MPNPSASGCSSIWPHTIHILRTLTHLHSSPHSSSRNVFLRVTDGRKYCWYSAFAWGATACMAGTAVFAHFFLDSKQSKKLFVVEDQETIGWLGIAIFFTPIACTILVDVFFYVTTVQVINRMNTYGRIHHKLKSK